MVHWRSIQEVTLYLLLAKNTEFSYKMTDYDYDSREQNTI